MPVCNHTAFGRLLSRAHLKLTLRQPVQRFVFVCAYTRVCMAEANGNFPPAVMAERGKSPALIIFNPQRRRATSAPQCREAKSHIAARFCVVQRRYNSLAERARDDSSAYGWIAKLEPVQKSFTTSVRKTQRHAVTMAMKISACRVKMPVWRQRRRRPLRLQEENLIEKVLLNPTTAGVRVEVRSCSPTGGLWEEV